MKKILFAFYTSQEGYKVVEFDMYDEIGEDAISQAYQYALDNYRQDNQPKFYMLTEMPLSYTEKTPEQRKRMDEKIKSILDDDELDGQWGG